MHITIVYITRRPVPPPLYGGGQRVMYWLGKALIHLGHQVTLIAHPDSHIPGAELRGATLSQAEDGSWVKLIPDSCDILHMRQVPMVSVPKPYVLTIGGNGRPGEHYPPNTIFLSRNHAELHGSTHFVHNGVDPDEYLFQAEREPYAVFLAKASWDVKNVSGAIDLCRQAGVELHVIGSRDWPLKLHRLRPKWRGVKYHGMLGQKEKISLLSRARCLVFPVRWHEPYGNAVNEALVSGCYVAATPYGSLPEIVTPEVGVLSAQARVLAEAVGDAKRFDPQQCRKRVTEGGLTHIDMAKRYVRYYENVLATGRLSESDGAAPCTRNGFNANQLLPWEA